MFDSGVSMFQRRGGLLDPRISRIRLDRVLFFDRLGILDSFSKKAAKLGSNRRVEPLRTEPSSQDGLWPSMD